MTRSGDSIAKPGGLLDLVVEAVVQGILRDRDHLRPGNQELGKDAPPVKPRGFVPSVNRDGGRPDQ